MHTVVIAPDSFKGTIGAAEAAARLGEGWARVRPHDRVRLLPMADGGEGTLDAFATAVPGARRMPITVTGPEGEPVIPAGLADLENAVLLPHLGSATLETRTAMGMKVVENITAFFDGRDPPDRIA